MGDFRGLSRLVSTEIGPHTLPQQSTVVRDQETFWVMDREAL
jgi:hypothetical protein